MGKVNDNLYPIPAACVPKYTYMEFYHRHIANLRISFLISTSYSASHYTNTESIRNYQPLPHPPKKNQTQRSFLQVFFFFF